MSATDAKATGPTGTSRPASPSQRSSASANGLRRNSDPALDPKHQHTHPHVHHAPSAENNGHTHAVYTKGTTADATLIPAQSPLHRHDVESAGLPPYHSDPEKHEERDVIDTTSGGEHGEADRAPGGGGSCTDATASTPASSSTTTSPKWRTPLGAAVTIGSILLGAFISEESENNTRENRAISLFGLAVLIFLLWASSRDRRRVQWRTVIGGMLAQYIIALFVLRTGVGFSIFKFIADRAGDLLSFSRQGTAFLTTPTVAELTWFLIGVIPAIMFFISIVEVLYYIGFIQWFIKKFATFVFWALRVSGAEAVVAAATPFIGQGESAMLVRPFVAHMTTAELHQILTCGFATISGSVLVAYVGLGLNAQALVSSCIMSIPASLAISKLRFPETEETLTAGRVVIPDDDEHRAQNALHAFANGAWFGLKIAGTIVTSILCMLAAVGLVDGLLGWWGRYLNISDPDLSLELIMGYICYPISFLLGVPRQGVVAPGSRRDAEIYKVAKILATKIIKVTFEPFPLHSLTKGKNQKTLARLKFTVLTVIKPSERIRRLRSPQGRDPHPRSRLIATYAICGFGNIGSLGIQVGILSQLAPSRGGDVSRIAVSALISGVLSTFTSAAMAGLVITDQVDLVPSA
ncbi:unnamed protein product [Parascedosporium putredinis]|uniref:Solute carrier family 28 member 3 n=1 Tax=Parascedosporium putredinis TaxID=1442378 RepID=A0A9P1HCC2_9PEZI|nr:unnamed protein product [Parascedosporium putredinis]CAI8004217.1 unnamed protein product [Parascedosporium putredinis]